MIKNRIETLLRPFLKSEEDASRLFTVIVPSFVVRSGYFLLAYLTQIALTRMLGPSRYGIFVYTGTIIFLLMNFSSYGFEVLALRFTSTYLSENKIALWKGLYKWSLRMLVVISTTVAAGTALFLWIFVYKLHRVAETPYTFPILVSCSIIPIYTLMNFYGNLLRGQNKLVISFLPDNTIKPLFLLLSLVALRLVLGQMNLYLAIALNLVSFMVAFMFVLALFQKENHLKKEIKAEYDKPVWRKVIGSLFILTCVGTLHGRIDTIMLRYLKDSSQVGIYYLAERDASALFFFQYIMSIIISPTIARLNIQDEKEKLQKLIRRMVRWVMVFSLPAFIGMMVFSKPLILLSGGEFLPGQTALIIICVGHIIDVAFGPVLNFVLMTGYEKYNTIAMGISIVMNVALNLLLTPRMGINGTAIAAASSTVFWNAYLFIIIYRKTGIRTWIFG